MGSPRRYGGCGPGGAQRRGPAAEPASTHRDQWPSSLTGGLTPGNHPAPVGSSQSRRLRSIMIHGASGGLVAPLPHRPPPLRRPGAAAAAAAMRSPPAKPRLAAVAACRASAGGADGLSGRRGVLIGGGGLLLSASTEQAARADGQGGPPAEEGGASGEAGGGAAGGAAAPPAGAAPPKRRKKRRAGGEASTTLRPRVAPKPPGTVPRVQLAPDLEVSQVIRGCWQLDGQHKGDQLSDRTSGAAAMEDLATFYRHGIFALDTGDNYGPSEAMIGQHLRLSPATAHGTKLLTKLSFMVPPDAADLRRENIEYRLRSSAARLGVTTLDMVQLHWEPAATAAAAAAEAPARRGAGAKPVPGYVQASRVLRQLQREGLVRHLGVSNFDQRMLLALLDDGFTPVSNQVSFSVIDRRPLLFLCRFCEARGIRLLAYGSLAGGLLAERYLDVPSNKVRIDTVSKMRYGTLLRQLGGWAWLQDMLRVLHDVGEKHGVSASCVAARWVLQQPAVAAVVLGARNATHVRDAQRLFSFELDDLDLLDIDAAYEGATQPASDVYAWERGGAW